MEDSIFTKIIKGEIPSYKVYEDEHAFAFLDIHPSVPGHVLVVPKKQVAFLWDLDDDTYTEVLLATKRIARHLRDKLAVPYVGEKVVGVDVPHAHIHLVPFTTVEEYKQVGNVAAKPNDEALGIMAQKLRM